MEQARGNLLGLDQALCDTGYAIVDPSGELITTGVIKTYAKTDYLKRLSIITYEVEELIDLNNIQTVYLEEVYVRGKGAWKILLEVKILLEMLCYTRNIPCYSVSSLMRRKNSWRKLIGLTTSSKEECKQFFNRQNEHIADAIGIATAGYLLQSKLHI